VTRVKKSVEKRILNERCWYGRACFKESCKLKNFGKRSGDQGVQPGSPKRTAEEEVRGERRDEGETTY
jgi:hypothetical protein